MAQNALKSILAAWGFVPDAKKELMHDTPQTSTCGWFSTGEDERRKAGR